MGRGNLIDKNKFLDELLTYLIRKSKVTVESFELIKLIADYKDIMPNEINIDSKEI
jgi:hypothetical protein